MISFFSKDPTYHRSGRVQRGSAIIRGIQVAEYLGARYNPKEGYEDDVCIYIKPEAGTIFMKKSYVDLVDGYELAKWSKENIPHPLIVTSQYDKDYLIGKFDLFQPIFVIPQHHCNYERVKRERKEVTTVGYIGVRKEFDPYVVEIIEKLSKAGFEFIRYHTFQDRQDVVDFYKKIDLQLIWRPRKIRMKNVLKLTNAMSFGIPTVAYPENCFVELDDYYLKANNIDELVANLVKLRDNPELYKEYSEKGVPKSEDYHIENIAELYKKL